MYKKCFTLQHLTENKSVFMSNDLSFGSLESFDLSWWMLDFVRLRDDSGGITTVLCRGSICGRCSFHYQLSQIFSGKGQTVCPQIGTWGVWFLACALQNEIFLSLSFINIKAQSSESKQSHGTAAKEMSEKCTYALVRKRLDFIWLDLLTLTTWHAAWQIAIKKDIPFVRVNTIVLPNEISFLYSHELCLKCSYDLKPNLSNIFWSNLTKFHIGNCIFTFSEHHKDFRDQAWDDSLTGFYMLLDPNTPNINISSYCKQIK